MEQPQLVSFSCEDGAALLKALGVQGDEQELGAASEEFAGHGLALVLLAGWLRDLHHGDVRCRKEMALLEDTDYVYFGGHAQRVMLSYESFFGSDSAEPN